ncbi:Sip1-related alpha-galactosidase [Bacillus sp. JJ1533]|uniref:Sip1-related alpha-galactosidase n=1 Tax=Bacillus sp. JJ1533 TaxID=3122959 RepID=UPI002FFD6CC1
MSTIVDQEAIHLWMKEQAVLQGLRLSVTLNNHVTLELTRKDTTKKEVDNYTELTHRFEDAEEKAAIALRFKIYPDITYAYVDVKVKNGRMMDRQNYLAPEGSVVIHVQSLGDLKGVMANYQHKDWWTRPHFSTELETLPERTQSFLWKTDQSYYYLLPVVDQVYRADIKGGKQGFDIRLSSFAGGFDECHTLAFVLGEGQNPFQLAKNTISKALQALGYPTKMREEKHYPERLDYLGWCSWDAFYHEVSESGIVEKMDELKEKNLPVKWVMIDDGWLDIEDNRLRSFDADTRKFPGGLSSISGKLKEKYGVASVGVWHTIAGYWGGVHAELAKDRMNGLYQTNSNKFFPHPDAEKGFAFWNEWHERLKKQGIDFVKVDSQSAINNFLMYQESIGESAKGVHVALEASVGIHFDQVIINCMGMAAENIFNRPSSSLSRNSDDFVPGEEISFKEHALQNAYNSYYHGHFYWGDWDMFWTSHEEDQQNAVLRAVSGGPIYFSDRVGETDAKKIWPLILQDGRILRADQPGQPTEDCLFTNPNHEALPLKIWNTIGQTGVIAAFNINVDGKEVKGTVRPDDIPSLSGEEYLLYDYFSGKTISLNRDEGYDFSLQKEEAVLFILVPAHKIATPVGLVNKYLAPKTITRTEYVHNRMTVHLVEGGKFFFHAAQAAAKAEVNGQETTIKELNPSTYLIECENKTGPVIIDIYFE